MKIFRDRKKLTNTISSLKKIAFVPTMGALHQGHLSLIRKAKQKSNKVLVSIFVNPKQFSSKKDFIKYPRKLKKDIKILKKIKVNYLYIPTNKDIYSFKTKHKIYVDKFSKILCGKFRPFHFKGVVNIVNRFLEIVKPKFIFLGVKDFQQLSIINYHMIKNNINTNLISCPTIREKNGAALSSRNSKLSRRQLNSAGKIYKYIKGNKKLIHYKILNKKKLEVIDDLIKLGATKIDYIECINLTKKKISNNINCKFNIFIAYYLDEVRLIDNL